MDFREVPGGEILPPRSFLKVGAYAPHSLVSRVLLTSVMVKLEFRNGQKV